MTTISGQPSKHNISQPDHASQCSWQQCCYEVRIRNIRISTWFGTDEHVTNNIPDTATICMHYDLYSNFTCFDARCSLLGA